MLSSTRQLFSIAGAIARRMRASRRVRLLAATVLSLCAVSGVGASALASPVTVELRVEGSAATLFEGPVTTSPETINTAASGGPHPCDYAENGNAEALEGNGGTPSGTPTTALHDAALATGLTFNAEWFGNKKNGGNPGDFFVTQVGPDVNEISPPFAAWGYAVNDTTAPVGGCQIALAPGSEVLWAYNYFNLPHLLGLSGPTSVGAGTPFTVHVVDGHTGEPLAGASIGEVAGGVTTAISGVPTTNAAGNATISLAHAGQVTLKATRTESVRSNGISVCVHQGNDGTCSTPAPSSPAGALPPTSVASVARVLGIKSGHVYAHRHAPRVLAGTVEVPAGGTLRQVRIRLERRAHGRCFNFSGKKERFARAPGCARASFFSVGDTESFSYLLPAPLPAGRYTYDIEAIDDAGQATNLIDGVSHVVFRVR
jgi:hypothetical protein